MEFLFTRTEEELDLFRPLPPPLPLPFGAMMFDDTF